MSAFDSYMKSPYRSLKHSTYFHVYDRIFSRFIGRKIIFVEIGVFEGGSLFMWRDFFGQSARIIGIDFNPNAKKWEKEGFEIFIGNQSDPLFWKAFFATIGDIDILLDDGGHTFEQQIITTEEVLPHIIDGGVLVVEDTHTSYMSAFRGPSAVSFISYAKNKIDGINSRFGFFQGREQEKVVLSVQFFESIVVFDVDRKLCALKSYPTENSGQLNNIEDFRFIDSPVRQNIMAIADRFRFLGKKPVIGNVLRIIYGTSANFLTYLYEMRRSRKLRRYFKYK
jgi:hypothetical protein